VDVSVKLHSIRTAAVLLLALTAGVQRPLAAQADSPPTARASAAVELRTLGIQRAAGPIRIDAQLDDAGWEGAVRMRDFVEFVPREGAQPPVETEVLLTYDDTHLYAAFIARDPNPREIRATLQPRDQLWADDWVGLLLDTQGDSEVGAYFLSNPIGVQGDLQLTAGNEDSSIDFIYHTAGRITDDGFVVEMAIPFSSLRFPDRDVQRWRVMLVRTYPRSSRHYLSWPALSQNDPCQLCQLGWLEGIRGVRPGGTLELLPAVVASQSGRLTDPGDPQSFESGRITAEPSLGLKYAFRGGWTAEATLNPDFSQVESDAAQVDVNTTFALFYPERRPFFQEGMDLYDTRMNVFYSRSINSPQAATKLTGRQGGTSIGYVGARDDHTPFIVPFEERSAVLQAGRSVTNVARVRRNLGDSYVGALFTDRRLEAGGSGTTFSVDGLFRFRQVYSLSAHLVGSYTREPDDAELSARLPDLTFGGDGAEHTAAFDGERYAGRAASVQVARNARTWSWNLTYGEATPTYRADTGFQTRNDFRRTTGRTALTFYPNRRLLERISPSVHGGAIWNFQGERKDVWIAPGINATLPRQTQVGINAVLSEETFRGVYVPGIRRTGVWLNSRYSQALAFGFEAETGRTVARTLAVPELGRTRQAAVFATLKPVQRVVLEPSIGYERLLGDDGREIYAGYLARTRFNFQYNRELQLRTVVQYNDFRERLDVEPLLVYRVNPFTIFYVGSTYGSRQFDELGFVGTDRQYFLKFQYLFRV
jgi:hypothetical protein